MIEPGQDPIDIVHISDLYTTFISIADAVDKIPTDRVIDGVDQTSLLMLGEDHGRRDYVFLYKKTKLESVRKDWVKMRIGEGVLPDLYNLMLDPAERFPSDTKFSTYGFGLTRMIEQHLKLIEKYPHTVQVPYQRELDAPFNPSPSVSYSTSKQVDW